jgi:hypothetical protein
VTRIPEYDRGYRDGVRAAATWLSRRAAQMSDPDPKTKNTLNSAATNLGWALKRQIERGGELPHYEPATAQEETR